MKILKKLKRAGAFGLICAVLFLCAGTGYMEAEGIPMENGMIAEGTPLDDSYAQETEQQTEPKTEQQTGSETEQQEEQETEQQTESENIIWYQPDLTEETGQADPERELSDAGGSESREMTGETQNDAEGSSAGQEQTEIQTEKGSEGGDREGAEPETASEKEADTEQETESEVEADWVDCQIRKSGAANFRALRAAALSPVIHRDNSLILSYLDFPFYFKYVTKHGMNTDKTVAAYCVYNTREAPEDEKYKPTGTGAFSKEISYCLYSGCRYRGSTAYNRSYSTGDWKKDYYITQVAIHIINYRQGRESSIEGYLNKSKDSTIMGLINKMVQDAYADTELIASRTNQTKEVTFTVEPSMQSEWIQLGDGTWRTSQKYVCSSNYPSRVSGIVPGLTGDVPEGVAIVMENPDDPMSGFYFTATDQAYQTIMSQQIILTAEVAVMADELGGWWYEPADPSVKRQYITYLAMETVEKSKRAKVQASASSLYFDIALQKRDRSSGNGLRGASYGLYRDEGCTSLVALFPETDAAGYASLRDLPYEQDIYYVKEVAEPYGYCKDETAYPFVPSLQEEITLELWDDMQSFRLLLKKTDLETGIAVPQGDATLCGAVYGLYAREDIYHPDGKRGLLYGKDTQVALLETDENAMAEVSGLYPGKYYLKELTAPRGYVRDETEHTVDLVCDGKTQVIQREICIEEQVKKQPFRLIKGSDQGDSSVPGLQGAGFCAWLVSKLTWTEEEGYRTEGITPVVLGENGETELFTDEQGCLTTIALPYGKYLVRETTVPDGHKPVAEFLVEITEHAPGDPQPWRILLDKSFMVRLKIVKKDEKSTNTVLVPGAEFRIRNMETGEDIKQRTSYPEDRLHSSFKTNEQGFLVLPEELAPGSYSIREVTAPEGYILNRDEIKFHIDSSSACQVDPQNGTLIVEKEFYDRPVTGEIEIQKRGELLSGFAGDFLYESLSLSGVTFEIVAEEDIASPDGQWDNGVPCYLYRKGTVVDTVVTDEKGNASVKDLPLGTYRIREKQAPFGFITDRKGAVVTLSYEDQNTPVVKEKVIFQNRRQSLKVKVLKIDSDSGLPLENARFGIYAGEDIRNADGEVIVRTDSLLAECMTDAKGTGEFSLRLPHGLYYVKEEKAPAGYADTCGVQEVDLRECDGSTLTVLQELRFSNEITRVEFSKTDATDGAEIPGAKLEIHDEQGKLVDQWTSGTEPHLVKGLEPGKTYTLTETLAPDGYDVSETITFTVENTGEIQKTEMKDERLQARVVIEKTDEESGKPLAGAVFELRTENGRVLETLKTGKKGRAVSKQYPVGVFENGVLKETTKLILQEIKAPEGYEKEEKEYPVVLLQKEEEGFSGEVVQKVTNHKEVTVSPNAPKTGDSTDFFAVSCIACLSGEALIMLLIFKRRSARRWKK